MFQLAGYGEDANGTLALYTKLTHLGTCRVLTLELVDQMHNATLEDMMSKGPILVFGSNPSTTWEDKHILEGPMMSHMCTVSVQSVNSLFDKSQAHCMR